MWPIWKSRTCLIASLVINSMERLWTRPYVLMIAGTFVLFTAFYALYPTLPLFIKQLGGNSGHVGLAMGVFMLASVVFRPIVGGLLDRFGRRPASGLPRGWVSQHMSYRGLFTVAAASVVFSLLVFVLARRLLSAAPSRTGRTA
jgi:MFS family permease